MVGFPLLLHGGSDSLHMRLWARSNLRHETESFKFPREDFASCQSRDRDQTVDEKYPAATETNPTPAEGIKKAGFPQPRPGWQPQTTQGNSTRGEPTARNHLQSPGGHRLYRRFSPSRSDGYGSAEHVYREISGCDGDALDDW